MEAAAPWQGSLRGGSSCDDVLAALGASPGALAGQTLLLTGATAGIGRALAAALAPLGPTLVCGCRSEEKGEWPWEGSLCPGVLGRRGGPCALAPPAACLLARLPCLAPAGPAWRLGRVPP